MSKRALARLIYVSGAKPCYVVWTNGTAGLAPRLALTDYRTACRLVRMLREIAQEKEARA